jgi:outer membrane immunogenic protein
MRRSFLLAAACAVASIQVASAADMPTKAPAYAPIPYNWTGFYIGGQAGGGWSSNAVTNVTGTANFPAGFVQTTEHGSGFLGGGYAGYNYQINQFVIGIDGDYSWAHLQGSATNNSPVTAGVITNINDTVKWIASLTGRVGYATNNWMFFGKAGWAWAGFSDSSSAFSAAGANTSNATASSTRNGWTIGTGVEWGFAPHWSAKLEYDYVKLNNSTYISTATAVPSGVVTTETRSANSNLNEVKVGVAYRF